MTRTWWHMSFVDPTRPPGHQWLGGLNTEAPTIQDAITWTHVAGLNPGGEISFMGLTSEIGLDAHYVDRLITDKDEWRGQPIPEDAEAIRMPYPQVNGADVGIQVSPLPEEQPGQKDH